MKELSCSKRKLYISSAVIDIFGSCAQKHGANEAGGILLGNVYTDYDEITEITTPTKLDQKGPMFFHRTKVAAQVKINAAWIESCGSLIYLGEWHTHTQINPKPSGRDQRMLAKVFAETEMDLRHLYMIVVGQTGNYWIGMQTADGLYRLELSV
jgi:integrative and conjugative element protein (TIGR02256 family)